MALMDTSLPLFPALFTNAFRIFNLRTMDRNIFAEKQKAARSKEMEITAR